MTDQQPQWIRKPIAPPSHIQYAHKQGRGMLTFEQIGELVKAINPAYVETKQRLTYLAQHQARAEMNRIFGYGNWDVHAEEPVLIYEEQRATGNDNKPRWVVAYRIRITVSIRDLWGMPVAEFTGVHAEENAPQPNRGEAHALALTSVDSYALRRALINLGDRFGLGLYNGGSTEPHGQYTIQLDGGQLFDWQMAGAQVQAAPMPTQGVTHDTIQAEPAVPEYNGTEQQVMQQAPQPQMTAEQARAQFVSPAVQNAGAVQQQLQQNREQSRAAMLARAQQGMKVDDDMAPQQGAEFGGQG